MELCEKCGRKFKNRSGLAGHTYFIHDKRPKTGSYKEAIFQVLARVKKMDEREVQFDNAIMGLTYEVGWIKASMDGCQTEDARQKSAVDFVNTFVAAVDKLSREELEEGHSN